VASGSGAVAVAAGESVIEAVDDGLSVRFFATLLHRSPDALQIPEPGRVSALDGDRVGAPAALPWRAAIRPLLADKGARDVKVPKVAPWNLVPALDEKRIEAISGYPHIYAPRLDKAGIDYRTHRLYDLGLRLPGRGFVARKGTIENRSADLATLARVTARAFERTKDNPRRAARIMHERFENLDEDALLEHLRAVVRLIQPDRGTEPIVRAWRATEKVLLRGDRIEKIRGPDAYIAR
jgi:ABC-type nitrate/sulfonate/bicarbonate transport system substrate-binding protein